MTTPPLDLVHLVWAPLGPGALARFLDSYRAHPAGTGHRLVIAWNGFGAQSRSSWNALLADVPHASVEIPTAEQDLTAYLRVGAGSQARRMCFVNSYSVILADGWLAALGSALDDPRIGMVGATGSWESTYTAAPIWLKPLRLRQFAGFPNPHLRTNAFMLDRELMAHLDWPDVGMDKLAALRLENGRRSLSRQVEGRGLTTAVVGRNGRQYGPDEWPASRTFRSGDQSNLLVGDNRTAEYHEAGPERRRELARFAWGASTAG